MYVRQLICFVIAHATNNIVKYHHTHTRERSTEKLANETKFTSTGVENGSKPGPAQSALRTEAIFVPLDCFVLNITVGVFYSLGRNGFFR